MSSDGDEYDQSGYDDDQEEDMPVFAFDDQRYGYEVSEEEQAAELAAKKSKAAVKRASRHLWHAALVLILERGRPVTRE